MALERVFGTMRDIGGSIDPADHIRLAFRLNGAAVGANGIVHSGVKYVDTFTGAAGEWDIELESTDALFRTTGGDVFYLVTIERRVRGVDGFPTDATGWRLRVPPGGGPFAALVRAPSNPAQIWVGPTPPLDPSVYTGWYKTDALPGEPNYFEWEE